MIKSNYWDRPTGEAPGICLLEVIAFLLHFSLALYSSSHSDDPHGCCKRPGQRSSHGWFAVLWQPLARFGFPIVLQ